MAVAKVKVEGAQQAEKDIRGVQDALNKFNDTVSKNRDATRLLDRATGGAITKFQDLQKGVTQGITTVKGLSKTFKGLRVAIAATGIGLIVVALGTIATYWDDIKGFISGATAELERQKAELERTKQLLNDEVDILNSQLRLSELKGESTDETLLALRKTLLVQQELVKAELLENQALLEKQKARDNEITFFDKLKASFDVRKNYSYQENLSRIEAEKKLTKTEEQIELEDKINNLKKEQLKIDTSIANLDKDEVKRKQKVVDDIEKKKLEAKQQELQDIKDRLKLEEQVDDALILTKADKRAKERADIQQHYDDLLFDLTMAGELTEETELALLEAKRIKLQEQQAVFDEEDEAAKQKEKEKFQEEQEERVKQAEAILEGELEMEEKKRKFKEDTLDNLIQLGGEESKLSKALLVAKQAIALQEFLIDIGALKNKASIVAAEANLEAAKGGSAIAAGTAETAKIGFPQNILPLLAYAGQAAGIIMAIKAAVSSTKSVASSAGGQSKGQTPSVQAPVISAPAFNIVGQSDTNQLAEAITGQTQEPIKAYVVSNDVTTAQSLDRNIVQGATIG
ncbi:MAG: hypothetical protein K0U52_08710 [Gammaproteobacteria bacterium]|nr:hypothetical protein [Gammaproteobacteria bacterium]